MAEFWLVGRRVRRCVFNLELLQKCLLGRKNGVKILVQTLQMTVGDVFLPFETFCVRSLGVVSVRCVLNPFV